MTTRITLDSDLHADNMTERICHRVNTIISAGQRSPCGTVTTQCPGIRQAGRRGFTRSTDTRVRHVRTREPGPNGKLWTTPVPLPGTGDQTADPPGSAPLPGLT